MVLIPPWPNPRMQRTPSAPLMRKSLGGRTCSLVERAALKITIRRSIAGNSIEAALPPQLSASPLAQNVSRRAVAHVHRLPPQQRVITLAIANRAVERLGTPDTTPVIAFAHDATSEARECLANSDVQLLTKRDFGWSDRRYHAIHGGRPH